MHKTPYTFLDTETTGLHVGRRPWEIAMIRREGSAHPGIPLVIQISDVDLTAAQPGGLAVGRFHERHQNHGGVVDPDVRVRTEREAAFMVADWTADTHIVGVNPAFDVETLAAMLRRHGQIPRWHYHLLDVPAMAIGWLSGLRHSDIHHRRSVTEAKPQIPYRSYELSEQCSVPRPTDDEKHTALGDARWAMRWFDHITGTALYRGPMGGRAEQ